MFMWWHRSVIIITISSYYKKVFITEQFILMISNKKILCKKNFIYKIAITLSLKFSSKSVSYQSSI